MKKLLLILGVGLFLFSCERIDSYREKKDIINSYERMLLLKDSNLRAKVEQISLLTRELNELKGKSKKDSVNEDTPNENLAEDCQDYNKLFDWMSDSKVPINDEEYSLNKNHPDWLRNKLICKKHMSGRKKIECFYLGAGSRKYKSKEIHFRDNLLNSKELVKWFSENGRLIQEDVFDIAGVFRYSQ
jgi:hypothetical protein